MTVQGKTILITGASDGIGAAAARELKRLGANVVIIGRSKQKTEAIAAELDVQYFIADFANLAEVRNLAAQIRSKYSTIDVLINNAGGIFGKREVTVDGHEKTFQVNHLAHFLLAKLLLDILIESKARVINTSSIANKVFSKFDVNDLELAQNYTPNRAYGNAKLENILFTKGLHARYKELDIKAAAFHPGTVVTNFANESTSLLRIVYRTPLKHLFGFISAEKGADTMVWLATTDDWESGEYYYKRKISKATAQAYDQAIADELWNKSEQMVV